MEVSPNEILKKLLHDELGYLPSGEGIDAMLERGQLEKFQAGECVIEMNKYCPDVFIVRGGIVGLAHHYIFHPAEGRKGGMRQHD